jgi:hypothetical protein
MESKYSFNQFKIQITVALPERLIHEKKKPKWQFMPYYRFKVEKCVCALSLSSEELLGSFYILSLLHTFSSHVENMATKN